MDKEKQEKLKQKMLAYVDKIEKDDPEFAHRIREKIDDLVAWYVENRRDITLDEFHMVLGKRK